MQRFAKYYWPSVFFVNTDVCSIGGIYALATGAMGSITEVLSAIWSVAFVVNNEQFILIITSIHLECRMVLSSCIFPLKKYCYFKISLSLEYCISGKLETTHLIYIHSIQFILICVFDMIKGGHTAHFQAKAVSE